MAAPEKHADDERPTSFIGDDSEAAAWADAMGMGESEPTADDPSEDDTE